MENHYHVSAKINFFATLPLIKEQKHQEQIYCSKNLHN